MANIPLASVLDGKAHLTAWNDLFEFRFAALELDKLLVYMIDTCDAKALPYLAEQFDLLGLKGWNAAKTDQDRRNLLKRAVELRRYNGTDYAIIRALQSVGYYDAEIITNPGALYNGQYVHNGFINYGGGNWACFAVVLDIGEKRGISAQENKEAIDLINQYKRAACKLLFIRHRATLIDSNTMAEQTTLQMAHKFAESLPPMSEVTTITGKIAPVVDDTTLVDGGITINFINLAGEVIRQETF